MLGVQFQRDSKEITTDMQLSAQLKQIRIVIHDPEEKTPVMMVMIRDVPFLLGDRQN